MTYKPSVAASPGVKVAKKIRTAGDYSLTWGGTSPSAVDTGLDLTLAAAVGDVIEAGVEGMWGSNAGSVGPELDFYTVVSGSLVTPLSGNPQTGAGQRRGLSSTVATGSVPFVGSGIITLGSGDISGGNVTVRLVYTSNTLGNFNIWGGVSLPLTVWLKNFGH